MRRSVDFFILFLFLLIFFCSTLILFQSVHHSSLFIATPLKVIETDLTSIDLQRFLDSFLLQIEEKREGLFERLREIREREILSWTGGYNLLPGKREEIVLPLVSFKGLEEIYLTRSPLSTIDGRETREEIHREERIASLSPTLLLLHSHTAETYYDDPNDIGTGHVSPGEKGLITQVGSKLAETLSITYGVHVHHEKRVHDHQYSLSYRESRKTVDHLLSKYPETGMVIDIHRDALGLSAPHEITTTIDGQRAARVLIVVTSDELGFSHPRWRENLQFAHLLGDRIEEMYPGLLRRIEVRENRLYNQDLHPRSILLEIGDYRNSTLEALETARLLASVIYSLQYDL